MGDEQTFLAGVGYDTGPSPRFEVAYFDEGVERRVGLHEAADVQFEHVEPVGEFPAYKGQRNNPGLWWSATTQTHVGHKSWFARDHLMLLDFDPTVTGISSRPFRLRWDHEGEQRSHAPDYFFRLCRPHHLGGLEADPLTVIDVVEEIARHDGSAAWCALNCGIAGVLQSLLAHEGASEIGSAPDVVVNGIIAPTGRVATDDPIDIGPCDLVLFCVKSYDTASAARQLAPLLANRTAAVSLQTPST